MSFSPMPRLILTLILLTSLPAACMPHKKLTVLSAAALLEEITRSSYKQSDLRTIRQGMPAYLLLLDGMVEAWPDNERLLISAAQAHASYASAFIDDADRQYANALYRKAKEYALKSLEQRGFKNLHAKSYDDFKAGLSHLGKKEVAYLFWTASCWGNWIGLNTDSMAALADLPRVESMMRRVLELDAGYYYGGPHLFMGIWYASQPAVAGRDLNLARTHFQKAIEFGQGQFLMTFIYYARYYARKAFDRDLFVSVLKNVMDTPADIQPELTLLNTVAQHKAKKMLQAVDDYF